MQIQSRHRSSHYPRARLAVKSTVHPTRAQQADTVTLSGSAPVSRPQPLKNRMTALLGAAGAVSGGVVGHMVHGQAGAIVGAVIGLGGGAFAGNRLAGAAYGLSLPPAQEPTPQAQPDAAQARVNRALEAPLKKGEPGTGALDRITNVVKAAAQGVTSAETHQRMAAKYKTLRLMDKQGRWIPALAPHSEKLLPEDINGEKLAELAGQMADVASENQYLMNFLAKAEKTELPTLRKHVMADGAEVLTEGLIQAQVFERLTSLMADDPKLNEACREHWKQVADTNPKFWEVQNVFEGYKTKSVNLGLDTFNEQRNAGEIDPKAMSFVLPLNIMEAVVVDLHQAYFGDPTVKEGHIGNAKAGWVLAKHGPQGAGPATLSADGKMLELHQKATKEWDDLYATWNMDFISVGQFWPRTISKLVIPAVNDYKAAPEQYLHRRALALQLLMYYNALSQVDGTQPDIDWRSPKMSNLWGATNLESARHYEQLASLQP